MLVGNSKVRSASSKDKTENASESEESENESQDVPSIESKSSGEVPLKKARRNRNVWSRHVPDPTKYHIPDSLSDLL